MINHLQEHQPLQRKPSSFPFPEEVLKRIDYVLCYPPTEPDDNMSKDDRKDAEKRAEMRLKFEAALNHEKIEIQKEKMGDLMYVKLHVPFRRLCREAEKMKLEMPLLGCEIYPEVKPNFFQRFEQDHLVTDNEFDFVSAPFQRDKLHIYDGHDNPDSFFRPALRALLTHHILINMDIRESDRKKEEDPMARKGLPYLRHKEAYTDAFVLHDESAEDPVEKEKLEEELEKHRDVSAVDIRKEYEEEKQRLMTEDTRKDLNLTWPNMLKYQPLWKIRNYFGEKIALYYAWSGMLIATLWIPTLFGLAIFFYGLYLSTTRHLRPVVNGTNSENDTLVTQAKKVVTESIDVIKESFDNEITPFFALIICLWGTVFLEFWKRKNAKLAYEWDVDNYEDTEPDRPQFYGTKQKADPVTLEETWYYPITKYLLKFFTSFSILIFMVVLVFISTAAVILYRVIMSIDFCGTASAIECLLVTTVCSSLLNGISIMILGKLYDLLAMKLTDWENHRTQTQYDDALIIKLFAFQFANSYTSLFYIAFFRGREKDLGFNGMFGLGEDYTDSCGQNNNCMSMLSFQVLILMLMKPLPKFLKDIVLPFLTRIWRKRIKWRLCCHNKVNLPKSEKKALSAYLEREKLKPDAGDLTLGEYMEKILQYGYLMLFAASFPLAPLIALLTNLIDKKVDAKRLLWWYRRPVPRISQDIGTWYGILEFLNIVGVISNAFLIAFTCTWGTTISGGSITTRLWIVIIFEHLVFGIKFLIAWLIPDVPSAVSLAMTREKYQVGKILELANKHVGDSPVAVEKKRKGSARTIKPTLLITNHDTEMAPIDENSVTTSKEPKKGVHFSYEPPTRAAEDGYMSDNVASKKKKKKKKRVTYDSEDNGAMSDTAVKYQAEQEDGYSSSNAAPVVLAPLRGPSPRRLSDDPSPRSAMFNSQGGTTTMYEPGHSESAC